MRLHRFSPMILLTALPVLMPRALLSGTVYDQTNLVSDIPGMAANTDPNLKNPWGVSFAATSPFWVSDQVTGVSTLYNGAGNIVSLVVTVPSGSPTGQVFNTTTGFLTNGSPASFIFDTLGGNIDGWNGGTTATVMASNSAAVYTGLALASASSNNYLYAANNNGGIDVYDSSFTKVSLSGSFVDPDLPSGYVPYNIEYMNGNLYVAYSDGFTFGAGLGAVAVFDTNGNFINELITPGGQLDAPWGMVIAPAGFGQYSNDLLVGNVGNGEIDAYNPTTGAFLGTLDGPNGSPIVDSGLWALTVRTASGYNPNAVYFDAGINNMADGLLGSIAPAPEPAPMLLTGLGVLLLGLIHTRRNHRRRYIP
jgi:uncharacterized protein (TIGR03118 family)